MSEAPFQPIRGAGTHGPPRMPEVTFGPAHGFVLLDPDGCCLAASPRAAELLGSTPTALIGHRFEKLGPWTADQAVRDAVATARREGSPGANGSVTVGSVGVRVHPLPGGPWTIVELEDCRLTRRDRANEGATAVLGVMGRLATGIAHDVNSTLAAIQMSFLLVKDGIPESHPHIRYVGAIEREFGRLATIGRRLHRYYRLCLDPGEGVSAGGLVAEAVEMFREAVADPAVKLQIARSTDRCPTKPGALLRHAVFGVLSAAGAVAPTGSDLVVTATVEDDALVVTVEGPLPAAGLCRALTPPTAERTRSVGSLNATAELARSLLERAVAALDASTHIHRLPDGDTQLRLEIPLP